MKHHWKLNPVMEDSNGEEFIHKIGGKTAAVVIGDRALEQRMHHRYIYDLGQAWKDFTGLGFIFAAWISNKKLDPVFLEAFNKINAVGFDNLNEIIRNNPFPHFDLELYYTHLISYTLDNNKRAGLKRFLELIRL